MNKDGNVDRSVLFHAFQCLALDDIIKMDIGGKETAVKSFGNLLFVQSYGFLHKERKRERERERELKKVHFARKSAVRKCRASVFYVCLGERVT